MGRIDLAIGDESANELAAIYFCIQIDMWRSAIFATVDFPEPKRLTEVVTIIFGARSAE